ncbi:DinB family protein [Janibacter indicus]|uniref:DinB family protein n=1 Tax=Janibacter indicus TaxID=857417 RepID=A0A7L9IZQ8_9MICO|nr:DinB family protein [Janibacter indicus]QOK22599.1 DinB family protein [Janibacter indicus]
MADLRTQLHDMLRVQRAALLLKLEGLDEYEARRPRTPTGTNLLGLVKHSAACELGYFGETFARPSELQLPWEVEGVGPEDNEDMFATEDESMADVLAWSRACFDHADATIGALPLEAEGRVAWWPEDRNTVTLGQIIVHMALDEARHAGHADILREQLDGAVGLRSEGNNLPEWDEQRWADYVARLTLIAEAHAP